jgi:perosamine synthetase
MSHRPIEFFFTSVSRQAADFASQVLQSSRLSEGVRVKEFETELSGRLGLLHPVAVNSGTSARHLALDVAGVRAGDEVVLPAQTFVATGLVVLMQRARPVFADIDPATGNMSPTSLREKITERTRAVMPVHWGGYPADLAEIGAIAAERSLAVIEDAAHALGATYGGVPIGAVSRFTAFSFQAIKHLTTGDGGALCCREEADAAAALRGRWFGIDRVRDKPDILGERVYDLDRLGYKYHMNDLAAAVGLGNLATLSERCARRRAIGARYREALAEVVGLKLLRCELDRMHAYWLFTVLVERREDFIRALASRGVPATVVHRRIDRNRVFGGVRNDLPGQAAFDASQVAIPLHEGLDAEDVETVIRAVRSGW